MSIGVTLIRFVLFNVVCRTGEPKHIVGQVDYKLGLFLTDALKCKGRNCVPTM